MHLFKPGFTLIEAILSSALFSIIITTAIFGLMEGRSSTVTAGARARAAFLAAEGLEAARSLRDSSFASLTDGVFGLATTAQRWTLSGSSDTREDFIRSITISSLDTYTKSVTSTVTWQNTAYRTGSIALHTILTDWRRSQALGGILVYADGGTTADTVRYRMLDASGIWGTPLTTADVDDKTTNRAVRSLRVFASKTRNEKILLTRHTNGTDQYIYAQVYDGTSWGNVQLLSTWKNTTFLDVQNFDGDYIDNGDFIAVASNNTAIPVYRVWDGKQWSGELTLPSVAGVPTYLIAKARPQSNEMMVAIFDQSRDTNTIYFNGKEYVTSNWKLHTEHASNAQSNALRTIDFTWHNASTNLGALIYSDRSNDKAMKLKIWTADDAGGGAWSAQVASSNQVSNLGSFAIASHPRDETFIACNKDTKSSPRIICFDINTTPAWSTPTNNTIHTSTDTGIQRSFAIGFETQSGETALNVYSDTSATGRGKKYDPAGKIWDTSPVSLAGSKAALETFRIIPSPSSDDLMILLADTNQDLYSIVWDGQKNDLYATPSGKAFSSHGTNGSSDTEFWFDFVWDNL